MIIDINAEVVLRIRCKKCSRRITSEGQLIVREGKTVHCLNCDGTDFTLEPNK